MKYLSLFAFLILSIGVAQHQHQHQEGHTHSAPTDGAASAYIEQANSPIAGLSQPEINDLLAGRGMGFARTAELTSYPGPTHLLELQTQLRLSAQQIEGIETIKQDMQRNAQALGERIVAAERVLSTAFRTGTITDTELTAQTAELATLYGELRAVHLSAHLKVTPLLSEQQILRYDELRGYR
ncbi:MAG: hypothetical protein AAF267_22225 [Deinococcota bacterium]